MVPGIISAVILNKRNPNYKTRLQRLQKQYQDNPPSQITMYQYPIKQLFCLFIILSFAQFLSFFQNQINNHTLNLSLNSTVNTFPDLVSLKDMNINDSINTNNQREPCYSCNKVTIVLRIIYLIGIIGLVCWDQSYFKKVKITKNQIVITKYSIIKRKQVNVIQIPQKDTHKLPNQTYNIKIDLNIQGFDKFHHNNQQYIVTLTIQSTKQHQRIPKQTIIRKGDIFHARKAIIMLCSVLCLKPNLNIKKN